MRSEERAGIVAVILLFLWGTLITEPLRVILDVFSQILTPCLSRFGLKADGIAGNTVIVVIFALLSLVLTILSKTKISDYIPCAMTCVTLGVYLVRTLVTGTADAGKITALLIVLVLLAVMYFMSAQRPLLWMTDLFVYAPAAFLAGGLILKPLWKISAVMSVIFYSGRLQSMDLSESYDGLLKLPGIAWGIFICIILLLPTAYYSAGRKKG